MGLPAGCLSFLTLFLAVIACISAVPRSGGGRSRGQNSRVNPRTNPCNSLRCQNGGYCDTLYSNTPQCVCPQGYSGSNCQNRGQDRSGNQCSNFRCDNGGSCATDGEGIPHCHCSRGYSGTNCETRQGNNQPPQSITNLRCDSACSTATSCRICLPCDTCQYQTICLAYEVLVKSLDADCHAQGYLEALLMRSSSSALGYSPIKCRGSGPVRDCPQGSSCVDDGHGGATCCRNRVGRDRLENKQGTCPAQPDTQTCGRLSCQGDIDCAGGLKCCQRCGNKCTDPNSIPVVISRDPCRNYKCQNGGRCTAPADAPYCECPRGYTGRNCENREAPADPCQSYNCENGGRCTSRGSSPSCQCPQGYTGPRCQTRNDPCERFQCLNRGRCVVVGDQPTCECPRDYRGPRCGIRDEPCQNFRCENGGRCVTRGDEPSCQCPQGYRGPRCGIRDRVSQDPCDSLQCQNGGRCRAQGNSAYCQCSRGYSGTSCENRGGQPTRSPPIPCKGTGCGNNSNDQCGGCPYGWTCQYINTGCPTLNCPTKPAYRCVSKNKK